jgi:hypothetical protein
MRNGFPRWDLGDAEWLLGKMKTTSFNQEDRKKTITRK